MKRRITMFALCSFFLIGNALAMDTKSQDHAQLADLKDFGSRVFAANYTIDEPGKWGVICLFKDADGKHTAKFWYEHGMM